MQQLNKSLLITACGFEIAFLCVIGFGVAPTMMGNWVSFAWVTTLNGLFCLIGCGMLWSDQFAESWNEAMGEKREPKLSRSEVKIEAMKIAAHPVIIIANAICMFAIR